MSQPEGYAAKIISEAQALIGKVQADLDKAADFYREAGINPDKVAPALEQFMGAKEKDEVARLVQADQEAVQREVDEGMAHLRFNTPASNGTSGARKPRPMV